MGGLVVVLVLLVALLCLLLWEIGQWRRAGEVLSARQRLSRLAVVALLGAVLGLMGVSFLGVFKTALQQALALAAMLILAFFAFFLALLDFRELHGKKREQEMRVYGEVVRFLADVARAKRAQEQQTQAPKQTSEEEKGK